MSQYTSLEDHDLRNKSNSKLGPPDVFRQEANQKEDRMSQDIVRQGYQYTIPVGEHEYASGKDKRSGLVSNQLIAYFCDILARKTDLNTFQDIKTKKQYSSLREIFTPSIPKYKEATDSWFKNLAGHTPLQQLSKGGIPGFNKMEDVLHELYRHDIPIVRAVWFIKLNALYSTILAESNKKKARQLDPSVDWTQHIAKAMLDLFQEIVNRRVEALSGPPVPTAMGINPNQELSSQEDGNTILSDDKKTQVENLETKFRYLFNLMIAMYDQGLLDRPKVLAWWINLIEKHATTDQTLKFILPYLLLVASYFAENEILCRRLLHWCTRCLSAILEDRDLVSHRDTPAALPMILENYNELSNCPLHRTIIMSLGGVVTALCQLCPSAVVWTDARVDDHYLHGSPLDALPCPLSHLPLPLGEETTQLRKQLDLVEAIVSERSITLEQLLEDRPINKAVEDNINRQMRILECLDHHNYGVVDSKNSMATLFENIFPNETTADGNAAPSMERDIAQDAPIIIFLCEWAVTPTRTGIHRPVVAATLLEKLRDLNSYPVSANVQEPFQDALVKFLDLKAPYLDPNNMVSSSTSQHDESFKNLICLFGELIDRDIFSHDSYVRYLIAKGEVSSESAPLASASILHSATGGASMSFATSVAISSQQPSVRSDFSGEDNDKLSFDNPDSVRSELSGYNHFHADTKRLSRHIQYLTHFPFLQDESNMHEANQRAQLLYGSGRAREQTKVSVKRLVRDITKLFTKRMYLIDAVNGELVKGKKRKECPSGQADGISVSGLSIPSVSNVLQHENYFEATHDDILGRFKALTYFDMESVIYQCNPVFMDAMKSFINGSTQHIPCVDNFSFFFELIELSLNVTGLVQTVTDVIQNLQHLDGKLEALNSPYRTRFISSLCLNIVGLLRKYHNVLMTMDLSMYHTFTGLVLAVRHLAHPDHCTSTQRCILVYLHELFQASKHTRTQYVSLFSKASCRINNTLFKRLEPAKGGGRLKPESLEEAVFREPGLNFATAMSATVRIAEDADMRYSWVCELFVRICHATTLDQCYALCVLAAEMTAQCNDLPPEWLGAFHSLVMPPLGGEKEIPAFRHINERVRLETAIAGNNLGGSASSGCMSLLFDNFALFVSVLLSRQCFTFSDFAHNVLFLCLACGLKNLDPLMEPSLRLMCHVLYRLFTADQNKFVASGTSQQSILFKTNTEPLLLLGALQKINTEDLITIMKFLQVISDNAQASKRKKKDFIENLFDNSAANTDGTADSLDVRCLPLGELAQKVLKEICSVAWVREKFLKDSMVLLNDGGLVDHQLTPVQARCILNLIFKPSESGQTVDIMLDLSGAMTRLLRMLNLWTLQSNCIELKLLLTLEKERSVLESVGRAIVDTFHMQAESRLNSSSEPGIPEVRLSDEDSSWLVPPLIDRLPNDLKTEIIAFASKLLESGNNFWTSKNSQDKERFLQKSSVLLAHPPFVTLLLGCLQSGDHKMTLLNSLQAQIDKFVQNAKEADKIPDDLRVRQILQESLQVRLGLVGRLFSTIQFNQELANDWLNLFSQLIIHGVVDLNANPPLFYIVLDMFISLVHSLITLHHGIEGRAYGTFWKRTLREIGEKQSSGIDLIKQLLPLPKLTYDVIIVQPHRTLMRGQQRISEFLPGNRKHGYQLQKKERLNPWEVIEDVKNYNPLPLSWFGAVRSELPQLRQEQHAKLLLGHEHCFSRLKPDSYYYDDPILPPEDLEPLPQSVSTAMVSASNTAPVVTHPSVATAGGAGTLTVGTTVSQISGPQGIVPPHVDHSLLLDGLKKDDKVETINVNSQGTVGPSRSTKRKRTQNRKNSRTSSPATAPQTQNQFMGQSMRPGSVVYHGGHAAGGGSAGGGGGGEMGGPSGQFVTIPGPTHHIPPSQGPMGWHPNNPPVSYPASQSRMIPAPGSQMGSKAALGNLLRTRQPTFQSVSNIVNTPTSMVGPGPAPGQPPPVRAVMQQQVFMRRSMMPQGMPQPANQPTQPAPPHDQNPYAPQPQFVQQPMDTLSQQQQTSQQQQQQTQPQVHPPPPPAYTANPVTIQRQFSAGSGPTGSGYPTSGPSDPYGNVNQGYTLSNQRIAPQGQQYSQIPPNYGQRYG